MESGKVKFYNPLKKFGFIIDLSSDAEYFFHAHDCKDTEYSEGDKVTFEIADSRVKENAVCAIKVTKYL